MKVLDLLVFVVNNEYEWMHFSLDDYLEVFEVSDEDIPESKFFAFCFDIKIPVRIIKLQGDKVAISTKEYSEISNVKVRGLFCNIMDFLESLDPNLEINNPFSNGGEISNSRDCIA